MNFALIENGSVTNTVICDSESDASKLFSDYTVINIDGIPVGIGWLYEDGEFKNPNAPQPPDDAELYEIDLNEINQKYESGKSILASAYLNAGLFDGEVEQQKKNEIYQRLVTLNSNYDQQLEELDNKYGE